VIVKKMSITAFVFRVLTHLIYGKPNASFQEHQPVIYFQTKSISILSDEKTSAHYDGDTCVVHENWEASVLPGAYRLIVP